MFTFAFEKLEVWHKAVALADLVCAATRKFPENERLGLAHQLRHTAITVASRIAEGSSCPSTVAFTTFVHTATRYTYKVIMQSSDALRCGFLSKDEHQAIFDAAAEVTRMLGGLRKSLLEKP